MNKLKTVIEYVKKAFQRPPVRHFDPETGRFLTYEQRLEELKTMPKQKEHSKP